MTDTTVLPFWPRYLGRELAALYVGVSVDVFDDEVKEGLWPAPRRRGAKGGRLTWDRVVLDLVADQAAGIHQVAPQTASTGPGFDHDEARWMERINGPAKKTGT